MPGAASTAEALVIDTATYNKAIKYAPGHGYEARGGTPSSILIHSTNNKRPTEFIDECDFLFSDAKVSAHYLISKAGAVVQLLEPRLWAAWHAGRALVPYLNKYSIGIELHVSVGERPTTQQQAALSALCRVLMTNYGIDIGRIDMHRAVALPKGRKTDPEGWDDLAFYAWRSTLLLRRYRFRVAQAALSSNDLRAARLAPEPAAPHIWQANEVIAVDDVTDGMAHDASGIGFAPVAVLEAL